MWSGWLNIFIPHEFLFTCDLPNGMKHNRNRLGNIIFNVVPEILGGSEHILHRQGNIQLW